MAQGTVKTITDRGFGFIKPDTGGDDLFFHRTALSGVNFDELRVGDKVMYNAENDPRGKGMRAAQVQLVQE